MFRGISRPPQHICDQPISVGFHGVITSCSSRPVIKRNVGAATALRNAGSMASQTVKKNVAHESESLIAKLVSDSKL